MTDFLEFPKIARLVRECVVTEKLDGTNASVCVGDDGSMRFGSRNRWITPDDDNFGFARWATEHAEGLAALGVGTHYGEWWGAGIQRRYGLAEKRFSLFNVARWTDDVRPACCHVVPTLYRGAFDSREIDRVLGDLAERGSFAAPGFMKPEGVVVWHTAARVMFKRTIEKDAEPKGAAR